MQAYIFLNRVIFWASTYVFASDHRLYVKTGLIKVTVGEISFEEIRKTDINYGLIGRFLGYGKLVMDARFVENTDLPYIYAPEKFAKLIHYENDLAGDVNLSYVTNGMPEKVDGIIPKKDEVHNQVAPIRNQETDFFDDFEDAVDTKTNVQKPAKSSLKKARL